MKAQKMLSTRRDAIGQGKSRQLLLRILCGASLMLAVASVQAESPNDEVGWQLEGTWIITVSIPGVPEATHLVFGSFLRDGVMIASSDVLPPYLGIARMDTGNGVWKRTGNKKFAATFAARAYNASGQAINMIKINNSFQLTSKNSIEGNGKLLICDLNLENCSPDSPGFSTLTGERLQVEPLVNP